MKSNSKHKAFALTKKGVASLVATALLALIALFGMTAAPTMWREGQQRVRRTAEIQAV